MKKKIYILKKRMEKVYIYITHVGQHSISQQVLRNDISDIKDKSFKADDKLEDFNGKNTDRGI